ncbi:MAG: hypothetical protein WDM92_04910 [Caulobacteraceae bacterium]
MSNDTPVTLLPPAGSAAPSVLQLPALNVAPNSDGSFTVPSRHLPSLLAAGWQIVVASGTTHVP